jgi:hypothetical protein
MNYKIQLENLYLWIQYNYEFIKPQSKLDNLCDFEYNEIKILNHQILITNIKKILKKVKLEKIEIDDKLINDIDILLKKPTRKN